MVSKNSEAPLAATFGASIENNREGNIDMNIVARSDLNFQGKAIVPVTGMTGIWLTSAEIANALQYKSAKSVTNLFNQNSDEFTSGMTQVIESVTSGNYRKKVRVFSLRGAHLIAMFARTDVAKEFRRWVLDILDREVAHSPIAKQFTDDELCRLAWMWDVTNRMQNFARDLYPAMRTIKSEYAGKFYDFGNEFRWTFEEARKAIAKASEH
ncbi:TPA: P22AR C-terminal domain-containing protein, partial [Klebsiella pneumoniae]